MTEVEERHDGEVQATDVEELDWLRTELEAERDRADRAEIESIIMLEMACRIREIAVASGFQVVAKCKRYSEEVRPLLENRTVLRVEVERRLVEKRNREKKQEDET